MLCPSCENKHEDNGDLAGMWQLTQWRAGDDLMADKTAGIYYTISRQLMKIQKQNTENSYICRQERQGDSLILNTFTQYINSKDSIIPTASLHSMGIPADGRFRIDILKHDHMQLSSGINTLQFRKY